MTIVGRIRWPGWRTPRRIMAQTSPVKFRPVVREAYARGLIDEIQAYAR